MTVDEALTVLGLREVVSKEDIHQVFLTHAKCTHPDLPGGSADAYKAVCDARDVLNDELHTLRCRSCRGACETRHRYCPFCGQPRKVSPICPSCKTRLKPEFNWCPTCGGLSPTHPQQKLTPRK